MLCSSNENFKACIVTDINLNNLDPEKFVFWIPPEKSVVYVGPDQKPVPYPRLPLPVKVKDMDQDGSPTENAVGEGVYDYLRQFPDCLHNTAYAELLRDGYAHYIADLAANAVMLDKKDVEPAYVYRKLTYLKILRLLEPGNVGLLWQLCRGFYDLAMTFTELSQARRHLLDAMRFGQALVKLEPENVAAQNLLAQIDILFGDYPAAIKQLRRLLELVEDDETSRQINERLQSCIKVGLPDHCLVDDLEKIADAMQLYAAGNYQLATEILERLEVDDYFTAELKSVDFLCLLGMCRIKTGDPGGAFEALTSALEVDPEHEQARETLDLI
jgi:tetratricopeptide (TPR) repeat protein